MVQKSFELSELILIQRVAMKIRTLSIKTIKECTGMINFKKDKRIRGTVKTMVFRVYKRIDRIPLME